MINFRHNKVRLAFVAFVITSLSGCFGNWPQLNQVADKITCSSNKVGIEKLAKRAGADVLWDQQSLSLTLAKADDAITVVFDASGKKINVIAKTQSIIGVGGLTRQQGDIIIVKRCL